jgi:hypothetical protein
MNCFAVLSPGSAIRPSPLPPPPSVKFDASTQTPDADDCPTSLVQQLANVFQAYLQAQMSKSFDVLIVENRHVVFLKIFMWHSDKNDIVNDLVLNLLPLINIFYFVFHFLLSMVYCLHCLFFRIKYVMCYIFSYISLIPGHRAAEPVHSPVSRLGLRRLLAGFGGGELKEAR